MDKIDLLLYLFQETDVKRLNWLISTFEYEVSKYDHGRVWIVVNSHQSAMHLGIRWEMSRHFIE